MKRIILSIFTVVCFANSACADKDSKGGGAIQQQAAQGAFASVGNHSTVGSVTIETRGADVYLILNEDFVSDSGPDLRVVLRDSTQVAPMIIVDNLQAFQGKQEYLLPLTAQGLESFDQVVIYCAKFHVDFGIASLN